MLQCPTKYLRILAVDDSPAFLRTLCSFFDKNPGVEVVGTANSAYEAFATIPHLLPDLVLMDLQMPGINGLEATAVLRRQFPAVLVIMLTAHDMPGLRQACKESGAYEFASKSRLGVELPAILAQMRVSRELDRDTTNT
jgi:DNA-binding NarL/FixJ family response regulator